MILKVALPFQQCRLDKGFRYLKYNLQLNGYVKDDWMWLVEKVE